MQRPATSGEDFDHAFAEEQRQLDDVVRFIAENHDRLQKRIPARSAYQEAANEIKRILQERKDSLDSALQQPYFGRLDYFVTAGPPVVTGASADDDEGRDRVNQHLSAVSPRGPNVRGTSLMLLS